MGLLFYLGELMRKLYIKQKIFKIVDKYYIKDENENDVYYVEQDFKLIGHTVNMYDMKGNKLFVLDREIFNLLPRYRLYLNDGDDILIQQKFSLLNRRFVISSKKYNLTLNGDFIDKDFNIYEDNKIIANINKKWFTFADTFEIEIYDEDKEIITIALMIAIDYLIDQKKKRYNS